MQNKLDELINSSIIEIINHSKNSKKLKYLNLYKLMEVFL